MMGKMPIWAEHLRLRDEVLTSDGSVGELQMSLGKVVYQTTDVPYRDADYWCEITEPTDSMVSVFADVCRRLWSSAEQDSTALFQFDQGMGGGKSHTLVGMWHMAHHPEVFFASPLGCRVRASAEVGGREIEVKDVHVAALCADQFSPGRTSPLFGPSENLFERFLWSLFPEDRATYDRFRKRGADKSTITEAFLEVGKPVLVLIDELMDYVAAAASSAYVDRLQSEEHQFLNALFDACDDVDNVVVLLVMIRSDLDPAGYARSAHDFRDFVQARVIRNGRTMPVTESKDFLNIIRRRLFESLPDAGLVKEATLGFSKAVNDTWRDQVFDRLPGGRNLTTITDRLGTSYPFHPDLVSLVQEEWSSTVGFQRVRSTVRIFASTLIHWFNRHEEGGWVPPLIGIGDLPLDGRGVLGNILNSGLLLGNDTAVQGFANLASTDVISLAGNSGRAFEIDRRLEGAEVDAGQPSPAVRMATGLLALSLVNRAQGARGATKPELLASIWVPGLPFSTADEVLVHLSDPDEGLGSLEIDQPENRRNRYWLSIKRTLNALHKGARNQIDAKEVSAAAWDWVKSLANRHQGAFEEVIPLRGSSEERSLLDLIGEIDTRATRLVILDPSQWTLLNGQDSQTRDDIRGLLGAGDHVVPHAASCVIATVNTHQRRYLEDATRDVLAWRHVQKQLADVDSDTAKQVKANLQEAEERAKHRIKRAFRHYAFIAPSLRGGDGPTVEFRRFEDDDKTSLRGDHVWSGLVEEGRATQPGQLAPKALELLLDSFTRPLTPKEVVQSFYGDPRFPLVSSTDDITSAWDGLLGVGLKQVGGWTLVGEDSTPRNVSGPQQVALNRMDATFQRVSVKEEEGGGKPSEYEREAGTGAMWFGEGKGSGGKPLPPEGTQIELPLPPFKDYTLRLPNVSLGDAQQQTHVWRILQTLTSTLDTTQRKLVDPQVIDLTVTVTMRQNELKMIRAVLKELGKGSLSEEEPLA